MRNENLLLHLKDESSAANASSGVERVAIKTKGLSRFTGLTLGVKKIKYSASAPAARRTIKAIKNIFSSRLIKFFNAGNYAMMEWLFHLVTFVFLDFFFTVYFGIIQTELFQFTLRTFWMASRAHIPAMQN